jgi:hypothetical protein
MAAFILFFIVSIFPGGPGPAESLGGAMEIKATLTLPLKGCLAATRPAEESGVSVICDQPTSYQTRSIGPIEPESDRILIHVTF